MPTYTTIGDLICVIVFTLSKWNRARWHVKNTLDTYINITMAIVFFLTIIDAIQAIYFFNRPFVSGLLRPIIVGCFI